MRDGKTKSKAEGVALRCALPNEEFDPAWMVIKVAEGVRERLLEQSLLSFTVRQKLAFESTCALGAARSCYHGVRVSATGNPTTPTNKNFTYTLGNP